MKNVPRVSLILALVVPFSIMAQTHGNKAITKSSYQIRHGIIDGSDIPFAPYPGRWDRISWSFNPRQSLLLNIDEALSLSHLPGKMPQSHFPVKANYLNPHPDEPARFPHQDPAGSYFYSCPISLANGQMLFTLPPSLYALRFTNQAFDYILLSLFSVRAPLSLKIISGRFGKSGYRRYLVALAILLFPTYLIFCIGLWCYQQIFSE